MIENKLSTKVWPHKDRIHNGIFSLILPNANRLDIVTVILIFFVIRNFTRSWEQSFMPICS